MKKLILIGFIAFAIFALPILSHAQTEQPNFTIADTLPTNLKATVDGGTIHLTWTAPVYIPKGNNAYVILFNTADFTESLTQYFFDNGNLYSLLPYEFIPNTQHYFYNQLNGTYYMKVATGTCTPNTDLGGYPSCKFTTANGYSPSINVEVKNGVTPDSETNFHPCKNAPAHSFDCIDQYKKFTLVKAHSDFGCLAGYIKKGDECVSGTGESSAVMPKPRISVGKPDLKISVAKAIAVNRMIKGVGKSQYKIGVTVSNKSTGDAVGDIYYSYNDNKSILVSKGGLAFGKSKKVFLYVGVTEKGKSYVFTVDPGNTIDETNENNNTATRVVGQ